MAESSQRTKRIRLPKTGAEALVALGYRGTRTMPALKRLTRLMDGKPDGRSKIVEVDLTNEEVDAVRAASNGVRSPGLGTAAKKTHEALREFDSYRPGARGRRVSRSPGQTAGAGDLGRRTLRAFGESGRARRVRAQVTKGKKH